MGGANVCTLWVWSWRVWSYTSVFPSVTEVWSSRSKCERSCLLRRFPCPALHWTCYHGVLYCVHSFKRLANQVGYIIVIARVAMDLWQRKQTLSSGCAIGLGSFTAINPCPRAITIYIHLYVILHSNGIMRMLTNIWKVKIVAIPRGTWKYCAYSMYDQDGATYSRRLTGIATAVSEKLK